MTSQPYYIADYRRHVANLLATYPREDALSWAVGGPDPNTPLIERAILEVAGLKPDSDLVDIGCGSGRLTLVLDPDRPGSYLGTDIVPELLDQVRPQRPGWRFELVDDLVIPDENESADMACLYSVITHLRHEDSYALLAEVARVIRPGGTIVVSFLEFAVPALWSTFETTVASRNLDHPTTAYVERNVLEIWATHLLLEPTDYCPGDRPFVNGLEPLGQSVTVLRKW